MLIDCPSCTRTYHITRALLGEYGRQVGCPRCGLAWFVSAVAAEPAGVDDIGVCARVETDASLVQPTEQPANKSFRFPHPTAGFWLALVLLALASAILGKREALARFWPPASEAYAAIGLPVNLTGLALKNLRSGMTQSGSLAVSGDIINVRPTVTAVPRLKISLRDTKGQEIYGWSVAAPTAHLKRGESIPFEARLPTPPTGASSVDVRFAMTQSGATN